MPIVLPLNTNKLDRFMMYYKDKDKEIYNYINDLMFLLVIISSMYLIITSINEKVKLKMLGLILKGIEIGVFVYDPECC